MLPTLLQFGVKLSKEIVISEEAKKQLEKELINEEKIRKIIRRHAKFRASIIMATIQVVIIIPYMIILTVPFFQLVHPH